MNTAEVSGASTLEPQRTITLRTALGVLAVLLGSLGSYWLAGERQRAERTLLARDLDALTISWAAVQSLQRNSVATYFEEYVRNRETLALLRAAQDPAQRDLARLQLFRRLSPAYKRLTGLGVRQFHFHLPNGDSLLRFHFPARFGDNLFSARESIRRVNTMLKPVFGFEVGRVVSGYRSVFPIFDAGGEHLGSVELSMPFKVLLDELQALLPDHSFELLLEAERQREILFDEQQSLYEPWPASQRFLIEDPHGQRPDSPPPLPQEIQRLIAAIGDKPTALKALKTGTAGGLRVDTGGNSYAVLHTPIYDPSQAAIGLLVGYANEPALKNIDNATYTRAAGMLAGLVALLSALFLMLRELDAKLAERQRLKVIADTMGQGLYLSDAKGNILSINPYGCQLLGYEECALLGKNAHQTLHRHEENEWLEEPLCPIREAVHAGLEYRGETRFVRADGRMLDALVVSRPLRHEGRLLGEVAVFEDIGKRKRMEEQLQRNAHYDALTNLPNRVLLADRLEQAMQRARRQGARIAIAFIDLDKFKPVNDRYGHDVGDKLLISVAERMRGNLREVDTLARLGGDEFVAVIGDIHNEQDIQQLVGRLLAGC